MAQLSVDQVAYAFVIPDFARQATTMTDPTSATYIKEGEVVVSGLNNELVTDKATTYSGVKSMKIVQRRNSGMFSSPKFDFDKIDFYKVTGYVTKTEKIIYLGYNGTAGSLENNTFIPGTDYEVKVKKTGLLDHYEDSYNTHKLFGYYNATATSGEAEVARGLVKNGVINFQGDIDGFVKIEMVSGCAATAVSATVSFVHGSKLAVATGATGLVACDFIKVNTEDTYYVESVNGNNIYLEVPYQGVSCTVTPKKITDVTSSSWGLKITGEPKIYDAINHKFTYDVSDFEITTTNFTNTIVTLAQAANLGTGTFEEVSQLEWEVQDYEGQTSHTDYLMPSRKTYAEAGKKYDILVIKGYDASVSQITGTPKSSYTVFVAIPIGNTQGDGAGADPEAMGVATALDTWLTTNTSLTYNESGNLT